MITHALTAKLLVRISSGDRFRAGTEQMDVNKAHLWQGSEDGHGCAVVAEQRAGASDRQRHNRHHQPCSTMTHVW